MNPASGEVLGATSFVDLKPGVSVIVRTCDGVDSIGRALESLAAQSLDTELYEIVAIPNGDDDGTLNVLRSFGRAHPELHLRIVRSPVRGIGSSMNFGVAAARHEYLTVVDDDDRVSEDFLKVLLNISRPDTIGHGYLADLNADGTGFPDFDTYVNRSVTKEAGNTVEPRKISSSLAFNTSKVVWTRHARAVPARENLRFATDVVYWHELVNKFKLKIHVSLPQDNAVYYRSLRIGSHSRPAEMSRAVGIAARLDAIEALQPIAADKTQYLHWGANRATRSQARGIADYLRSHPDEHSSVVSEITERGIEQFPWHALNRERARDLVTCYAFPPSTNTSSMVAGRRVRARGLCVDVIMQDLAKYHDMDPVATSFVTPYVGNKRMLNRVTGFSQWKSMVEYANSGFETIEEWEEQQGPYRSVYSRAMWPASHVLAALHKVRRPDVRWIAEFSDPLSHDVHAKPRKGERPDDKLGQELEQGIIRSGEPVLSSDMTGPGSLMPWIEHLAYALADEILFTNENQRSFMLEHVADEKVRQRALDRSVVAAHPTLPAEFYQASQIQLDRVPGKVHVAYFGAFYATRGLTEVVEAIRRLPRSAQDRLAFHVYTKDPEALRSELSDEGLDRIITPHHYVPYLDFLHLTTQFDCLLVNDARTLDSHSVNPYLPSKLSDYNGSGTPIWAVVEQGSILSQSDTKFRSLLGDVGGALEVLHELTG